MFCRHVYEYVGAALCPDCGKVTHEPDREREHEEFVRYYAEGHHLKYTCPLDGGTIRGWWSI